MVVLLFHLKVLFIHFIQKDHRHIIITYVVLLALI